MDGRHQEQQSFQKQEVEQTSYMQTQVKVPVMKLPTPSIITMPLAQELVGEGFQASISRISGVTQEIQQLDTSQMDEEVRRDYEAKLRETEMLQQQFDKEVEKKTEAYRKQQEIEAELIRKMLEKQHIRDVDFRKELVEHAIENQKRQIDIESRYAKKELERERAKARMLLERQKFHSDIQVNLDSTAASTHAGEQLVSESEKFTQNSKGSCGQQRAG